ncbi:GL10360 [Drosophila persimilis]|uniref:GL10360 n=1 Tax=Drosophila persimilis TaxID=7234 RepID=B4GD94_DROPE|nr:GL10360 [Drosophila persimilis]
MEQEHHQHLEELRKNMQLELELKLEEELGKSKECPDPENSIEMVAYGYDFMSALSLPFFSQGAAK